MHMCIINASEVTFGITMIRYGYDELHHLKALLQKNLKKSCHGTVELSDENPISFLQNSSKTRMIFKNFNE